ncbi:hypothetical protein AAG607_03635 [Citromicrobium bathyomarinum]|jgi:hypothetical protein|uniref:hypothetical protein n=1 Tax=Sphingomonadales TaxID=204457 RepID=UPI0026D758AC|tara:strand:+ start:199 stop:363 length:165 start_codon:yes stop_codon:yes gene_type:complete
MKTVTQLQWGAVVILVALLNIAGVLPDWTTFAAIVTLPYVAISNGARCGLRKSS